ncbi:MAG: class I SAM-dependent methyltransferase [Desulfobacula sp.]|jgi:SAM-dependent methyltransferase
MGYNFDFKDAVSYDAWFFEKKNQYGFNLEINLLMSLLAPEKGQRILDIGCGTGISLEPLMDKGLSLTGIDPSPYMLESASKKFDNKVDLHKGFGEDLPFDDNSFDAAFFFTSLEFMDRPAKAIEEACRVAKDTVVICVLNRYAPLNMIRRFKSFFVPGIYAHADFFSIWELKRMMFGMLGSVPVKWKTTLQFPFACSRTAAWIENNKIVQKSVFGTMIGMKIRPVPKFRTRALTLKVRTQKAYNPVTGLATRMRS